MKLLILSDFYPPIIGGGERHVESLSRALNRRRHQVCVCTIRSQGMPEYEQSDGITIYRLEGLFQKIPRLFKDQERKWPPPVQDPLITAHLRQVLEETKPDIIHAHGRILYSGLALKKEFNIPIIFTLHSFALLCPKTTLLKGEFICDKPFTRDCITCSKDFYGLPKSLFAYVGTRMGKSKIMLVDRFIAVSAFTKDVHVEYLGLSDKDIVVVPNFVDIYTPGQDKTVEHLPEDFILFVGALIPAKGVDLLIQAFQKLRTKTSLVIIGTTHPDYHYRSAENIYVIKDVSHHTVLTAMSKCRFAVFPSILPETFALVSLEAMSQRKAVIASNIGGLKELVVNNETGILVPPNSLDSLSGAISYLLGKPEEASRMGEMGHSIFLENYTPNTVIPKLMEVYESMIEG
ncbi:glycosyltransferase family 4 protein [Chloroflexota bacterium]